MAVHFAGDPLLKVKNVASTDHIFHAGKEKPADEPGLISHADIQVSGRFWLGFSLWAPRLVQALFEGC